MAWQVLKPLLGVGLSDGDRLAETTFVAKTIFHELMVKNTMFYCEVNVDLKIACVQLCEEQLRGNGVSGIGF